MENLPPAERGGFRQGNLARSVYIALDSQDRQEELMSPYVITTIAAIALATTTFAAAQSSVPHAQRITDLANAVESKVIAWRRDIQIPIARLVGKWKVSQNRSARDREGVVEGLMRED